MRSVLSVAYRTAGAPPAPTASASLRPSSSLLRASARPPWRPLLALALVAAAPALPAASPRTTPPSAGAKEVRLNRVIEKLAQQEPVFGIFSSNVSTRTGASVAGSKIDFVIIDLEHSPYDVTRLESYLLGMIDKREILTKGNLQPGVVPIVRVPSAGREQLLWVIKQVLDLGVFGLVVPHIDTPEDAVAAVRAARFPQMRGVPDYQPEGLRGIGYGWPARYWGLGGAEYAERADLWPLDPKGELMLWLMIETRSALDNIQAIARTPGIGGLFVGPSDLAFSLGVPFGDPAIEAALAKVAQAAKEAGISCGTLTSGTGITRRLEQGYTFLAVGSDGGVGSSVQEARKIAAEFQKKQKKGGR